MTSAGRAPVAPRRRYRRLVPSIALATVLALVLAGFALTNPLPTPVRSAARTVGLPVDSVELASARTSVSQLEAALDVQDAAAVEASAADVRAALDQLDRARTPPDRRPGGCATRAGRRVHRAGERTANTHRDRRRSRPAASAMTTVAARTRAPRRRRRTASTRRPAPTATAPRTTPPTTLPPAGTTAGAPAIERAVTLRDLARRRR